MATERSQAPLPGVRLLWFSLWGVLTLALLWPLVARWWDATPPPRQPTPNGYNYLIIAASGLQDSAQAWAAYRQERGYQAAVITVNGPSNSEEIRWLIHEVYQRSGEPYPFYVLLLGHSHPNSPYPDSYLPTDKLALPREEAASWGFDYVPGDGGFARNLSSGGQWRPIAIGRIPAPNERFALDVLRRVQRYETQPPIGEGRNRVELIASSSTWGKSIDQLIERLWSFYLNTHLPNHIEAHVLYGNPDSQYSYPLHDLSNETARRFDSGALLVSYTGHGDQDLLAPAVSQDGSHAWLFSFEDLHRMQGASDSVMTFVACSVGQFDLPGSQISLAEALLLFPKGPVATYAASRITFPLPNTVLEKDLLQILLKDRAPTAGEWLRRVRDAPDNPGIDPSLGIWVGRKMVPYLYGFTTGSFGDSEFGALTSYLWQRYAYNLFGDPALKLAYSNPELQLRPQLSWLPIMSRLHFSGNSYLPAGESILVTLNYPAGVTPDHDREAIDQRLVYARTNSKTLAAANVIVDSKGRFKGVLDIPPGVPSGRYILQAVATSGTETLVGGNNVYLGLPLIEPLRSTPLWWFLISLVLWGRILYRASNSNGRLFVGQNFANRQPGRVARRHHTRQHRERQYQYQPNHYASRRKCELRKSAKQGKINRIC